MRNKENTYKKRILSGICAILPFRILFFLIFMGIMVVSLPLYAQKAEGLKTETFKVWGHCESCKLRIEKAAKTDGVTRAVWDVKTKMLSLTYDPQKTTGEKIQKQIAAVGHDTEKFKADDKVFAKLPGCCKYERRK